MELVRNKWWHGWGVRWVPGGSMYNVWGLDAVELRPIQHVALAGLGEHLADDLVVTGRVESDDVTVGKLRRPGSHPHHRVGVDGSGGALYTENDIVDYMDMRREFLDNLTSERKAD